MRKAWLAISTVAFAAAPASALTYVAGNQPRLEGSAAARYVTGGSRAGLTWQAQNTIIGQTPTSAVLPPGNTIGGGDTRYYPSGNKSGVVALIMEYNNGNRFICSGSLLAGGMSIATAGHCVSSGGGVKEAGLVKTTAYFFNGNPDERTVAVPLNSIAVEVSRYFVNPEYTGDVIDQNDIAILRLKTGAPSRAERYDLYTPISLTGTEFNVAGYGTRSTVGGAAGNTAPDGARTGYLREGDNVYDYAWGDSVFGGFFTDIVAGENFFGTAEIASSYVSDFDNGLDAQSQSDRICAAVSGPAGCAAFIDNGLGDREVGIAGGDSGGPGFVDGKLASINSYGLTFGAGFGDFGGGLNSGFGEFSGYVPVYIHEDFIAAATAVPEPSSWALLIAGFGLTGAAMRRQRRMAAPFRPEHRSGVLEQRRLGHAPIDHRPAAARCFGTQRR